MSDYCAECGEELKMTSYGACIRCCHGWGYWAKEGNKFQLYINLGKWPRGLKAVKPNAEGKK